MPDFVAGMAVALFSGRDDWHRRVAYFALFGAIGWSFGGSQSYMHYHADYNTGTNTIHAGGDRDSWLLLPVIPANA